MRLRYFVVVEAIILGTLVSSEALIRQKRCPPRIPNSQVIGPDEINSACKRAEEATEGTTGLIGSVIGEILNFGHCAVNLLSGVSKSINRAANSTAHNFLSTRQVLFFFRVLRSLIAFLPLDHCQIDFPYCRNPYRRSTTIYTSEIRDGAQIQGSAIHPHKMKLCFSVATMAIIWATVVGIDIMRMQKQMEKSFESKSKTEMFNMSTKSFNCSKSSVKKIEQNYEAKSVYSQSSFFSKKVVSDTVSSAASGENYSEYRKGKLHLRYHEVRRACKKAGDAVDGTSGLIGSVMPDLFNFGQGCGNILSEANRKLEPIKNCTSA
ncbi:hypothetical protein AAG570_009166 [Ranatra chinensis]|uniref:Uncharacterized protein n=1 Tax=Ranatra chinensis TaxID=642074 RepID=A0ABD0YT40_9HEMI